MGYHVPLLLLLPESLGASLGMGPSPGDPFSVVKLLGGNSQKSFLKTFSQLLQQLCISHASKRLREGILVDFWLSSRGLPYSLRSP